MIVQVNPPSGGWYQVIVNGEVVAMTKSQRLAALIAADIQTRILVGRDWGG